MVKQFRLDEDLANQLKETADILNKTESEFIREAIMEYINKYVTAEYHLSELINKYQMTAEDIERLIRAVEKIRR